MMKRKEKTIQVQDDAGNPDRVIIYVRVLDASDQDDPTATLEGMREARLESTGEHLNVKEPGQLFQSVDGRRSFRALK